MSDSGWKPTLGKDSLLDTRLRTGTFNGNPIYIHITSVEGRTGITKIGQINATPKKERRGEAAKDGIYLNPHLQTFSPLAAFTLLFFETETYRYSATDCIVFSCINQPGTSFFNRNPLSEGSWVEEIIYTANIKFADITILYIGANPFGRLDWQNHPIAKARYIEW